MRFPVLVAFAALLAASAGCSRGRESPPTPAASSSPVSSGTLRLGEPVTSQLVPLAEIAGSPSRFANEVVATTGKVTAVCQEMGCWMEIQDQSGTAHVRMHGHQFFVPKTAAGHLARVQARVLTGAAEGCLDSPPPRGAVAKVELDATGVELD
jgi:hypothetical protein